MKLSPTRLFTNLNPTFVLMRTLPRILSAALLLTATVASQAAEIIPFRSGGWSYKLGTAEASTPIEAWRAPGFDITGWLPAMGTASAPIGYPSTPGSADLEGSIQTSIPTSAAGAYRCVFLRKEFTVSGANAIVGLSLQVQHDDGFVAWINGVEVGRGNVVDPLSITTLASDHEVTVGETVTTPNSAVLVEGTNTLAIQLFNATDGSSDIFIDARLTSEVDEAPVVSSIDPPPSSILQSLTFINVAFNENVTGVTANDLVINGVVATGITTNNPRDYTFTFAAQPAGTVTVNWSVSPQIFDTDGLPTAFAPGGSWTYTLDPNIVPDAVIISEFMADNTSGISDEDGTRSDWIELYNPGLVDTGLGGWFLTDDVLNPTKWRIPGINLGAGRYTLIWASEKNRINPSAPLHTNFRLSRSAGSYLALVNPATNVVSVFTGPTYPAQVANVSYGRDRVNPNLTGYFSSPTPRAANSTSGTGFTPAPVVSHESGVYTNATLSFVVTVPANTTVRYTTDGSNPTNTSTAYTGPINIANNTTIKLRAYPTSGSLLPGDVVVRNFLFLDGTTAGFNSNIPVLVLSTEGRNMVESVAAGSPRTKGTFVVFDTFRGRSSFNRPPDHIGPAEFEIFGQTSAGFAKKPYNIEIQDAFGVDAKASFFGMPAEADWKLRNPYADKCLMNDYLAYEMFEQMGNYSVRRQFVEVFVDTGGGRLAYPGDYIGVEVFLEKIERGNDRVDISELTPSHTNQPSITGGWMFKRDKASGGDLNFNAGGNGYKLHEPKPKEMRNSLTGAETTFPGAGYTPAASNQLSYLVSYINQLNNSMNATNWTKPDTDTNHYSNYIDVDTFVDSHWIVEMPKQIDGYRISNFFSKDRNGKVKNVPIWDWNLSFGNADYLDGGNTNGWYYTQLGASDHVMLRGIVGALALPNSGGDPDFVQKLIDRWGELRTNVMNGTRLTNRIDEIANLLRDNTSGANSPAGRNFTKYNYLNTYQWPNPQGAPTWHVDYTQPTYELIISEMKKWTYGRYLWIDGQFPKSPALDVPEGDVAAGTTVSISALAGTIYYTTDGTDPRAQKSAGAVAPGALTYSAPITINNNARVFARARVGTTWSPPAIATYVVNRPRLVITEIMYHPAPGLLGGTNAESAFEYVELKNVGATPLNLNGYTLGGGISFTFPNRVLAAGEYVVVANDVAGFNARYPGLSAAVAGEYTGNLANEGNRLVLKGRFREPILDFDYNDAWYPITDGFGFSLVINDANAARETWGLASSWHASGALNGNPGNDDGASPSIPRVVINEALTHSDPAPPFDTIELRNLSDSEANIGGWYLTDDFRNPKKFRIPNGVTIPANGYITFDETAFNSASPLPGNSSFALSSSGDDEVYVFSGDGAGNLTGYHHGFEFGPALNGVTYGRHVTSTGEAFVAQTAATLGAANAPILVGPIVITEIMYHPQDVLANGAYWDNSEDEFIELRNIGGGPVTLQHGTHATNAWKLDRAVEFSFPQNTTIAPGGYLLVVNFNPATEPAQLASFRSKYNVGVGVQILGPYKGQLDNSGETVALFRPDNPEPTGNNAGRVPYVLVDQVDYSDNAPWALAADGYGHSLQRISDSAYGDDVVNWGAGAPSAAAPFVGGTGPTITTQPTSRSVVRGNSTTLSVAATGAGPLRYQWRFNGNILGGATSQSLSLPNIRVNQGGDYECMVMNPFGAALSSVATVTVLVPVDIITQPVNQTNRVAGTTNIYFTNITFGVQVSSPVGVTYQWQFNGADIPGATGASYFLAMITNINEGTYRVRVTDPLTSSFSQEAYLKVLTRCEVVQPAGPIQITAVAGENITFGTETFGTLPIGYRWRRMVGTGASPATVTRVVNSNTDFLTISNISGIHGGSWAVILSNIVWTNFNAARTNFIVSVLADSNGNGLPDTWETAYFGSPTGADRNLDSDNDGSKNWEEYTAGTDPTNPASYLRVQSISATGGALISFNALAAKTYTIEYRDGIDAGVWNRLGDIVPRNVDWTATLTDPTPTTNRYYRIATPKRP